MTLATIPAALRCVERALEHVQRPDTRVTRATLFRWFGTLDMDAWAGVQADYPLKLRGEWDLFEMSALTVSAAMLANIRSMSDARVDAEILNAELTGNLAARAWMDSVRKARTDRGVLWELVGGMLESLRRLDARLVLLLTIRKHKTAILDAFDALGQDSEAFLHLIAQPIVGEVQERARCALASLRRRVARPKPARTVAPNLDSIQWVEHEGIRCSLDYRVVLWGRERFEFKPGLQSRVVEELLKARTAGIGAMSDDRIAAEVESRDKRLSPSKTFWRHPALHRLIVRVKGRRNLWTIAEPPSVPAESDDGSAGVKGKSGGSRRTIDARACASPSPVDPVRDRASAARPTKQKKRRRA